MREKNQAQIKLRFTLVIKIFKSKKPDNETATTEYSVQSQSKFYIVTYSVLYI